MREGLENLVQGLPVPNIKRRKEDNDDDVDVGNGDNNWSQIEVMITKKFVLGTSVQCVVDNNPASSVCTRK